jgi:hypothetical protein
MRKAKQLFYLGLIVHTIYVLIIVCTHNRLSVFFQPDTGQLTELISNYSPDSRSYIESADNFIERAIFGRGDDIDFHRTVGYPFIISICKLSLGEHWYFGLALLQIILGSLIYPLCFFIGKALFQFDEKTLVRSIVVLMILGGYFTKSLYVLTDLTFAVFFLLGFYLSILSVTKKINYFLAVLALVMLTISGLIRPTLLLYPIASALIMIFISKKNEILHISLTRWFILIFSLTLWIGCNLSSFRLYKAYHSFSSTDVLGINMFDYSVKSILTNEGKKELYTQLQDSINSQNDWLVKDKIKKQIFIDVVKTYPISSISYWKQAAKSHLLSPHYMEIGAVFGYYKEDVNEGVQLKKSSVMLLVFYVFYFINWLIELLFVAYIIEQLFIKKNFLWVVGLLTVIAVIVGPSFIALTGARMRISIEPFILLPAILFLTESVLIKKLLKK